MATKKAPPVAPDVEPYAESAAPLVPETNDLEQVCTAAAGCTACHLWHYGTQTVFGSGNPHARIMLVGEQPGDTEDIEGLPFVGPAGQVLDKALDEAGIDPKDVYKTNAVKHFKWEPRGFRRLHKKPNRAEMEACRPWLQAEIQIVRPRAIVLLGATAAQAVLGPKFKVTEERGKPIPSTLAPLLLATVHPSSILRMPDPQRRHEERIKFVSDLRNVSALLQSHSGSVSA